MRIGSSLSVELLGLQARLVQIQAFVSPGLPYFALIGLPDASLGEARERVKSAICASGVRWPQTRVTVNLSPASLPKRGSSHDVAIACAILQACGIVPSGRCADKLLLGELNLDGTINPVPGILPTLLHAREIGLRSVFVPRANYEEARLVEGLRITPLDSLPQVITLLGGELTKASLRAFSNATRDGSAAKKVRVAEGMGKEDVSIPTRGLDQLDLADVIGQDEAKRALEICAAGNHHLLMSGPPGAGKTMLALRLPSILPPLEETEALEVASIRSLCGTLPHYGISRTAPFEAPHHTSSPAAISGGGAGIPMPGAVTKAHHGVLFLDEAPEFSSRALQCLREPLETGTITLSRSKATMVYPARFLLVMAANPCPCGKGWGTGENCTDTVLQRRRYWNRLSGPLLDRIDIQIEVPPVHDYSFPSGPAEQANPRESSDRVRGRVIQARNAARERFRGRGWAANGQADPDWFRVRTGRRALALLQTALEDERLTLRGADRALRLSWTISDLEGRTSPGPEEVAEAIGMRSRRR